MEGGGGVGVERLAVKDGGVTPAVASDTDGVGVGAAHSGTASDASDLQS